MKTLLKTLAIGAVGGMLSVAAQAGPVDFSVSPGAAGATPGAAGDPFTANGMSGSFSAVVNQDNTGAFTETGLISFGSFTVDDVGVFGSGLGGTYNMYALFQAEGQVTSFTLSGTTVTDFEVSFNNFLAEIYVDPVSPDVPTGLTGSSFLASGSSNTDPALQGFTGQKAGSQFADAGGSAGHSLTNTDDDVLVLSIVGGQFKNGRAQGNDLDGAATGSFRVKSEFSIFTGFFDFFPKLAIDLDLFATGQIGSFSNFELDGNGGLTNATFTDTSANVTFIPEPTTVGLFGLGLLGLGAMARRRRRKV